MTNKYNAGITSYALWLNEFKICLSLYAEGKSTVEIKQASDKNNIFEMHSRDRAKRASRNLTRRVLVLPDNIIDLFPTLDIGNQKLVALLSMMLTDRLLDEFVYEVYRKNLIIGAKFLKENEVEQFIINKQIESEQLRNWTDKTVKRVEGSLKTILRDAGLLERHNNSDLLLQPFISLQLLKLIKKDNLNQKLASLRG